MIKYFLFASEHYIDKKTFANIIASFYVGEYEIVYTGENEGYVVADEKFALSVGEAVPTINSDLGTKLVFVCTHAFNQVSTNALYYSYQNMQGFNYLSDVVLEQLFVTFAVTKNTVISEFKAIPHELILTAQAYLKAGLNAKAASEMLYIHRNTFNYRLNKFIVLTKLDIRDYWHAFLL